MKLDVLTIILTFSAIILITVHAITTGWEGMYIVAIAANLAAMAWAWSARLWREESEDLERALDAL